MSAHYSIHSGSNCSLNHALPLRRDIQNGSNPDFGSHRALKRRCPVVERGAGDASKQERFSVIAPAASRGKETGHVREDDREQALTEALEHLKRSLEMIDAACAPPHIGAYVDLALNELYSALADTRAGAGHGLAERSAQLQ